MKPFAVGEAIEAGIVALPGGQGIEGGDAGKGGKFFADAFSVLLPLSLYCTPGPLQVLDRKQAHD